MRTMTPTGGSITSEDGVPDFIMDLPIIGKSTDVLILDDIVEEPVKKKGTKKPAKKAATTPVEADDYIQVFGWQRLMFINSLVNVWAGVSLGRCPGCAWYSTVNCECETCPSCENKTSSICTRCDEGSCCCGCAHCASCNEPFDEVCDICEYCENCCECSYCSSCDAKVSEFGCYDCKVCYNCGCGCNGDGDNTRRGYAERPPWEIRGITVTRASIVDATEGINDYMADTKWQEYWPVHNNDIDPVQSMADFYLLDGVAGMVFNHCRGVSRDPFCRAIAAEAAGLQAELVALLDPSFQAYCDMAIGGELRYHRCIGNCKVLGGGRARAWIDWKIVRDKVGPDALLDAALLFREIEDGGIGGDKWAVGAEILHQRVTNKMSPHTFVDRVFTLQHNGGSFLNKILWKNVNAPRWQLQHMMYVIGPAHSANPTAFGPLLAACRSKVSRLFTEWWTAANKVRRANGVPTEPPPTMYSDCVNRRSMIWQWRDVDGDMIDAIWNMNGNSNPTPYYQWAKDAPRKTTPVPEYLTGAHVAYLRVMLTHYAHHITKIEHEPPAHASLEQILPGFKVGFNDGLGGMPKIWQVRYAHQLLTEWAERDVLPEVTPDDLAQALAWIKKAIHHTDSPVAFKSTLYTWDWYITEFHGTAPDPYTISIEGGTYPSKWATDEMIYQKHMAMLDAKMANLYKSTNNTMSNAKVAFTAAKGDIVLPMPEITTMEYTDANGTKWAKLVPTTADVGIDDITTY